MPRSALFTVSALTLWILAAHQVYDWVALLLPGLAWVHALVLVGATAAIATLLHLVGGHWRARGAFDAALEVALASPWGEAPLLPGPWATLDPIPPTAKGVEPPVLGQLAKVFRRGSHGPTALLEENDHGLCFVHLVGVTPTFTRWVFAPIATEEGLWLEDGRRDAHHILVGRDVLVVDISHGGHRFRAYQGAGFNLPASYLPTASRPW